MDDPITDERLREIIENTYCCLDEGPILAAELLAARAEVERLRASASIVNRVGWLDHLDTPEGRSMHATEAVKVENEELRADLREAVALLRNLQRGYLLQESWAEMEDTYRRIGALFDKHKETP